MSASPREARAFRIADNAARLVEEIALERSQARLEAAQWRRRFDRVMDVAERQQAQLTELRSECLQMRAEIDALARTVQTTGRGAAPACVAMPESTSLLTLEEARQYLRLSRKGLYLWIRSGKVRPRQIPGARPRFTKADLDAALRAAA